MRKFISFLMMAVLCAGSMFAATYTVAGDSETLFGEGKAWKSDYAANDMTLVDGLYTWEKSDLTLASGIICFKVCKDHGWTTAYPKDNYELKILESGVYTVKITFNESTTSVNAVATKTGDAEVIPTIAMHGNFTGEWNTTENFTLAGDKKTASFKLNIKASATKYQFGMRIGGSGNWTSNGAAFTRASNSAVVNAGSGNMTLLADADGEYTFTWTYETNTLTITYPEGAVIDLPKYYVTGDSALIVDAGLDKSKAWSPSAIKSMKDTFELNLKANQEYKLKITLGGDWKTGRGYSNLSKKADGLSGDNDDNINFKLNEAGAVKVVFKALENDTTFELLGNFFIPDPATVAKFYVTGDSALIVDAGLDKSKAWSPSAIKSMKDTLELTLKANQDYMLKITLDGDWKTGRGFDKLSKKIDGLSGDKDGNICFKLNEAGAVKVVFKALENDTTFELLGNFFIPDPEHKDGFYMMSSHNEWAIDDNYMFAATETEGEYILNVTLAVDQEIKPAYVEKDAAKDWYGADNYKVPAEYAGARTIYFRPAGNEDTAWQAFGGFFYIVPNDPTGMESIQPSAISSQKVIENGMLIIEKAGVKYNAMGQKIQ